MRRTINTRIDKGVLDMSIEEIDATFHFIADKMVSDRKRKGEYFNCKIILDVKEVKK